MKVVFHDVDGCLNADASTAIPRIGEPMSSNQAAKLKELGQRLDASSIDHLVINTGRSIEDTLILAEFIDSAKLRYIIGEHGAVYHDVIADQAVIFQGAIADKLELIKSFIRWYRETGSTILNKRVGMELPILDKVANLTLDVRGRSDTSQICDELQAVVEDESPFDSNQFIFHHSQADGYVDAMSQIDKGDGVEVITSLFAQVCSPSTPIRSFAFGNGLNDMPMLKVATTPVCPGNAEPEVRQYCRDNSGVVSDVDFIDATLHWFETNV